MNGLHKSSTKYEGFEVDIAAINLLQTLVLREHSSKISNYVKQLNETLAKEQKG